MVGGGLVSRLEFGRMTGFPLADSIYESPFWPAAGRLESGAKGCLDRAMAENLNVKRREKLGGSNNRRLRRLGQVPAVLYGHGEASVPLAIESSALMGVIRHGGKLVKLAGDLSEGAFIKAVQWDVFGKDLVHVDLLRVSETEMVRTTVTIELKGTAAGLTEGGIIEFVVHEIDIECPAAAVPEKLIVNVSGLHLGDSIHARELALPAGATLLDDEDMVIVHCIAPHVEAEPETAGVAEPGAVEPELIRKEKTDEDEGEEKK
jgi:large subunit ribosomal protein L25